MNVQKVISSLKSKYPGRNIIQNGEPVSEVVCEVEPAEEHPSYSVAVAVIDRSEPHLHRQSEEEYEVIKGKLELDKGGNKIVLIEGDKIKINPGEVHSALGQETWVKVYSRPGWRAEDHLFPDHLRR